MNGTTGQREFLSDNASDLIQNCIDGTVEGTIHLTPGTYPVDSSITLKSNIALEGEGDRNTVLDSTITDGSHVITSVGVDDSTYTYGVQIRNLMIEGNGAEGHGINLIYSVRDLLIEKVWVATCGQSGIYLHHCYNAEIRSCHIQGCDDHGIWLEDRSHATQIITTVSRANNKTGLNASKCGGQLSVLGGNYQNNDVHDIFLSKLYGATIQGVYFENENSDVWMVNITDLEATWTTSGSEITGCYFLGGATVSNGIYMDYANGFSIIACYFTTVKHCINISSDSYNILVLNPRMESCTTKINNDSIWVTILWDAYLGLPVRATPSTGSWGDDEKGYMWFSSDTNKTEYWNGTDVITLP